MAEAIGTIIAWVLFVGVAVIAVGGAVLVWMVLWDRLHENAE